ncbi:MAG: Crp/Fnr family transcriptional regulator [Dehalococcoidia bacterium]
MGGKILHGLRQRLQTGHQASAREVQALGKMEYLSRTDLFRDFSPEEMRELDRMTSMVSCRRGKVFYEPEQAIEVLFVLKQGQVHLYRLSPEGKKLITATVEAGTVFGEMTLLGQSMYGSYAEAAEDCLICLMSRADLEHLIMSKPAVALRVVELLSRRVKHLETRLEMMAFKSVSARLAAILLDLATKESCEVSGVSHQDLADMVGTYRETITRILDEWRLQGLVDLGRMRIRVRDAARLTGLIAD